MSEDAFSGSLADLPLDAVLQSLANNEHTGVLRIGDGNEIWLDEGQIYLVLTESGADVVSLLFGGGEGTIAEISTLVKSGTDVANELAERASDGGAALERLLHEHNLQLLFELLVPSQQSFAFDHAVSHPIGSRYREATMDMVNQAQKRLELWSQIATRIPNTAAAFKLSTKLPMNAEERVVTADEWRYISLLDGRRSVAEVINVTQASAFRVCSSLYRLLLEGVIEEVED